MSSQAITATTTYFTNPGKENTEDTLRLAKRRAQELSINTILVASTSGETGVRAAQLFEGFRLIVVSHSTGLTKPDTQELEPEHRSLVESHGATILTATHAFGGVGRAVRRRLNTYQTEEIIAYTLRVLGEGMKVACEIALMAADAGLVRTDQEVVSLGGTGRGADTAVVLKPAHAQDFFDIRVNEIICKPRL